MLQHKDIKNLSELTSAFCTDHKKPEFFPTISVSSNWGNCMVFSETSSKKGSGALSLIEILLCLPFIDQGNVHGLVNSGWRSFADHGKDIYYRLKKNHNVNWRNFLSGAVKQVLSTLKGAGLHPIDGP